MDRIVVYMPELTGALRAEISAAAAECGCEIGFFDREEEALAAAAEAEIILGQSARLPGAAPRLKWMCTPFAGVDGFLREARFAAPDALLTCSAGAYGLTISEHVILVTLDMMRRAAEYRETVAQRQWKRGLAIHSIYGSRITVLGTGDIGTECALRLRAFHPAVIRGVNRRGGANPAFDSVTPISGLDALLPETDLLIMALPGTAETDGLMDAERLARLKEGAYLVNVGRGSAVDEAALEKELRAGRLGGAALDVFRHEPLPADSSLWSCPRLLITPHIAGNLTLPATVEKIARQFIDNLRRFTRGEPMKALVDKAQGY